MILEDRLKQALESLPDTPGGVADYLIAKAIRGRLEAPRACPLARWLRAELTVPLVEVDDQCVTVLDDQDNRCTVNLATYVCEFIRAFDLGKFPDLVDGVPPTAEELWMDKYGDLE